MFDASSITVSPKYDSYHSPDSVIISCAEGYFFGGEYSGETSYTMTCQSDGSWDRQTIPFCERE